jgi:hypothetical protein
MRKQICACGCGDQVTPKVESRHLNALAPALLASEVLEQNRKLIRRKKRSQAIHFPAPLRQQLTMGDIDHDENDPVSLDSSIMMGAQEDHVYGQSKY